MDENISASLTINWFLSKKLIAADSCYAAHVKWSNTCIFFLPVWEVWCDWCSESVEADVCSTWDSFKPLLFTLACSQRQSSRELNGWIYAAPKSINVPFLCVHLASWPLCSPHFEWMLLGGPKSPLLIQRDGVLLNPYMKITAPKCWWNLGFD